MVMRVDGRGVAAFAFLCVRVREKKEREREVGTGLVCALVGVCVGRGFCPALLGVRGVVSSPFFPLQHVV